MVFLLVWLAAASAANAPPPAKHTSAECVVWAREVAFAKAFHSKSQKSFADFLYPAVALNGLAPGAYGPDEVAKAVWTEYVERPTEMRWRPVSVSIGRNPNYAIVTGPRAFEDKGADVDGAARYMTSTFRHIWRLDPKTKTWMIEFDGSEGDWESAGGREALDAHLAVAPQACPK